MFDMQKSEAGAENRPFNEWEQKVPTRETSCLLRALEIGNM